MAGFILLARRYGDSSLRLLAEAMLAAGIYAALFLRFAISRNEQVGILID